MKQTKLFLFFEKNLSHISNELEFNYNDYNKLIASSEFLFKNNRFLILKIIFFLLYDS